MKKYTLLVCILFIVSLSSCSDNPVTPGDTTPKIVDSSRFFISSYFEAMNYYNRAELYLIDTSEYFLYSYFPAAIGYFKNRVEHFYPLGNNHVTLVNKYNSNLIFGADGSYGRRISLLEWNGNGVTEIASLNALSIEDTLKLISHPLTTQIPLGF